MATQVIVLPPQSTNVSGSTQPSGLSKAGLFTLVTLASGSWTPLPASALADRNAMAIQNQSGIQIKLNFAEPAGYEGIKMEPGAERSYDIQDDIIIFAKSESGTPVIGVEELS